jgi:hypothetical protein
VRGVKDVEGKDEKVVGKSQSLELYIVPKDVTVDSGCVRDKNERNWKQNHPEYQQDGFDKLLSPRIKRPENPTARQSVRRLSKTIEHCNGLTERNNKEANYQRLPCVHSQLSGTGVNDMNVHPHNNKDGGDI